MRWYEGKNVFITGGSSGIGKSLAKRCAQWGANVAIGARGQKRLDETLEELKSINPSGTFAAFSVDISDKEAVDSVAVEVVDALGGIDVLINNAGVAHPGYFEELGPEVFDSMMNINYFGTVNVTRAFLPYMVEQKSGDICNVSSFLGTMAIFGYTAYAGSKFAVTGFTEALRQEVKQHNIHISIIFPADVDTPQLHAENEIKPFETKALAGNITPMQPDDLAPSILNTIAKRKLELVPGLDNKFVIYMDRHFRSFVRFVTDQLLRRIIGRGPKDA